MGTRVASVELVGVDPEAEPRVLRALWAGGVLDGVYVLKKGK